MLNDGLVPKINTRSLKVEQRWPTAPCASPSSIAMDRLNRRLFIGCRSKVMAVMNADTGQVIATLPIGDHVDATAFDPDSRLVFNSNGEGTITVIHQDSPDKYSVVETVKTLPRAKTMALDPKTHHLFLSTDVDFVFIVLHHPPYTSSSDAKIFGGGHSARSKEKELAKMLEARQQNLRARIVVFSGHVHNYERHEHGGITYFVTGGAGAHAYPIERAKDDPFQSKEVNYHYIMVDVDRGSLKVTMHRLDLTSGKAVWTEPDSVTISVPVAKTAAQSK